jgi:hypothetical protein
MSIYLPFHLICEHSTITFFYQFQELLQQKQKEADRQKQIREKQAKLEAERAEKEKAERVEVTTWYHHRS